AETVFMYVDALALAGQHEKALAAIDGHLDRLAESADSLLRASEISYEHGSPARTLELLERLLHEHGTLLGPSEEAIVRARAGHCLRKLARFGEAVAELERASRLDAKARPPLTALAEVYADRGDYRSALDVRHRELQMVSGEERAEILLGMAEIAA